METINHMFFERKWVCMRWATIAVCLMGSHLAPSFTKNFLGEILYVGISRAKQSLVP